MFIIENITDIFLPIWTLWVRCGYVLWANLSLAFLARFELWAKALWANLSLAFLARFELWAKALWANLSLAVLARFELWAKALWANLSLSRARSELRDWLTRPLLGSPRRDSVATLYATLITLKVWMPDPILYGKGRCCRIHIDTQEYQKKVSDSVSKKIGIGKKFRILFRSDFGFRHTLLAWG